MSSAIGHLFGPGRLGPRAASLSAFAWLLLAFAPCAAAYDPPRAGPEGPRAMVLLSTATLPEIEAVKAAVQAEGGRVTLSFQTCLVVAFLPEEAAARIAARPEVLRVSFEPVPLASLGPLSRDQEASLALWNDYYMGLRRIEGAPHPIDGPGPGRSYACGIPVPAAYRQGVEGSPEKKGYGAGDLSTSEYMILDGQTSQHRDFQVNIVFPESNGAVDASTENWVFSDEYTTVTECIEGLEWWAARYAPARIWLVVYALWSVPTPWEPINRAHGFEATWVDDLMDTLGYGGSNYFYKVRNFDNNYFAGGTVTWRNTIFIVNSKNDADGNFTDGWFNYSYFGGPFLVMTWDNGWWGSANTDYLCAHETGHTFYALDEYASSGCTDTEGSGYLNVPNGNCENGGGTSVECIMRNNNRIEFTNGSVCSSTREAIGWRDTDADSIPNVVDHPPLLTMTHFSLPTTCDSTPTFTGSVVPEVEDNVNPLSYEPSGSSANEDISVNSVVDVEYRLNGGAWQAASPADGIWDEADEEFSFTTGSLGAQGANVIEARARNSRGIASAIASDTLTLVPCAVWTDDFEDGSAADWTIVNTGASISVDNAVARGSWSLGVSADAWPDSGAWARSPEPPVDLEQPYTVSFWFRWSTFHWSEWLVFGHVRLLIDQPSYPLKYDPVGNWSNLTGLGAAVFEGYIPANTWKPVSIEVTPAARRYSVTIDGSLLGTVTYDSTVVPAASVNLWENSGSGNWMTAWYDDFRVEGSPSSVLLAVEPGPGVFESALLAAPNPFNPETSIRYVLPRDGRATLRVYGIDGTLVRSLLDRVEAAGPHAVPWDGRDQSGRRAPSGTYVILLTTSGEAWAGKATLLR